MENALPKEMTEPKELVSRELFQKEFEEDEEIYIGLLTEAAEEKGATHFTISHNGEWENCVFTFYKTEKETDTECRERMDAMARYAEQDRIRKENNKKRQEQDEYCTYLALKKKYEKT